MTHFYNTVLLEMKQFNTHIALCNHTIKLLLCVNYTGCQGVKTVYWSVGDLKRGFIVRHFIQGRLQKSTGMFL